MNVNPFLMPTAPKSLAEVQADIQLKRDFQDAREARALVKETFMALLMNPATVSLDPTAILDRAEELALAYQARRPRIPFPKAPTPEGGAA